MPLRPTSEAKWIRVDRDTCRAERQTLREVSASEADRWRPHAESTHDLNVITTFPARLSAADLYRSDPEARLAIR
jgi:hypothetical protein